MADLRNNFVGIKSPNPFWLASAPPTDKAYNVERAFRAGWGGVVWKTLGEEGPPVVNVNGPRYGAIWGADRRLLGFNNIELITDRDLYVNLREMKQVKMNWPDRALIASIMNEFVAVTSTNIAKILNIYPKKGAILVGADADLVVWDPKRSKTISAKTQQSAIDYNVFEGKTVTGLPRFTLTRGVVSIEEGTVKTQEGHGEFVRRDPFPAVSTALSTWKEVTAPRAVQRSGIPASGV